jgi:hypothetical protein
MIWTVSYPIVLLKIEMFVLNLKQTVTERVTRPYQIFGPAFNFLLFVMKLAPHTF